MATVETTKHYTPEDLLRMPDGDRYELVDGHLVETSMSTFAALVATKLSRRLDDYCEPRKLGWVLSEAASYQCFPDAPAKVRKPDLSFIRISRMTLEQVMAEGHIPIFPDLGVEVLSPNDLAYEVDEKVQDYQTAGVPLVWVIHPQTRRIDIYRLHGVNSILNHTDELDGEDVIPGFRCRVADIFPPFA